MFVIKRNQVVVTALAVMIAAAGYLNFQESRSSEGKQTALQLTEEGDVTALVDYSALPDDADETETGPDYGGNHRRRCGGLCFGEWEWLCLFCGGKAEPGTISREGKGYFDGNAQ